MDFAMPKADAQDVEPTLDGLDRFIADQTQQHWDSHQTPWLISSIPAELKARGIDYRSILGEQRLKAFAQERSGSNYQVVTHPSQRAKVGLIPAGKTYEFPEEPAPEQPAEREELPKVARVNTAYATIRFLRALGELEDEDLDSVVIPTRVLVKLLSGR